MLLCSERLYTRARQERLATILANSRSDRQEHHLGIITQSSQAWPLIFPVVLPTTQWWKEWPWRHRRLCLPPQDLRTRRKFFRNPAEAMGFGSE